MAKYTPYAMSATETDKWSECKALMQWTVPGFMHLFYKMLNPDQTDHVLHFTTDLPTLATDGRRILANPEYFFKLTLKQQVFACCHEIEHAMKLHMQQGRMHIRSEMPVHWKGKDLPYRPMVANFAQDFVINADLVEAKVGEIHEGWLFDKNIATSNTSWQEAYHNIWRECEKNPGKYKSGTFDEHLPPGASDDLDPDSSEAQPDPQEWQQAVIGALAVARSAGKLPANIEKMFEDFLKPAVKWTDHIEALFARHVGGSGYDYRRLDRRMITRSIGAPGKSGRGAGTIVVGSDSSGSIYGVPRLIERFFGEVGGILEDLNPRRIVLMWCDAEIRRVDEIESAGDLQDAYYKGATGGGGTSFVPVFEKIEEMGLDDVDALVYLTDGDGEFPAQQPDYPVIWGDISGNAAKYPWGKVVLVPNDGSA